MNILGFNQMCPLNAACQQHPQFQKLLYKPETYGHTVSDSHLDFKIELLLFVSLIENKLNLKYFFCENFLFRSENKLTCRECIRRIYQQSGIKGFYKGISASYFGVSETVVHLVIYEAIKAHIQQKTNHDRLAAANQRLEDSVEPDIDGDIDYSKETFLTSDYLKYMLAGACSKTCATCLCYPHGESFLVSLTT